MSARLPANACHSALVKLMGDLGHSAHSLAGPADMSTNTVQRAVQNLGTQLPSTSNTSQSVEIVSLFSFSVK